MQLLKISKILKIKQVLAQQIFKSQKSLKIPKFRIISTRSIQVYTSEELTILFYYTDFYKYL